MISFFEKCVAIRNFDKCRSTKDTEQVLSSYLPFLEKNTERMSFFKCHLIIIFLKVSQENYGEAKISADILTTSLKAELRRLKFRNDSIEQQAISFLNQQLKNN